MRRKLVALTSVLASLGLHAGLMAWLALTPARFDPLARRPADPTTPAAPVAGRLGSHARGQQRDGEIPLELGGARSPQNVDRPVAGGGGDGHAPDDGVLLAMNVDDVRLQDTPWNAVGVAQLQRIETDRSRASWDDRRATPHPHDQPFLASGDGNHPERRVVSVLEPNRGAPQAPSETAQGAQPVPTAGVQAAVDASPTGTSTAPTSAHPAPAGAPQPSPGTGIAGGHGARQSAAAPVAHARPPVDEAPAATLATERDRPRDDTNSELLATQLMQSWVDATPRSARQRGAGNGGAGGGGPAGSGEQRGEGGQAAPHAPGPGGRGALDTRDARYQSWLLAQRRRVYGAMVFPRERLLAMDQGVVVYAFRVDRAGRLVGAPQLARSSGFPDLDAAALRAIRATLPTAPPPPALMAGRTELPLRMHLNFSNPMVR